MHDFSGIIRRNSVVGLCNGNFPCELILQNFMEKILNGHFLKNHTGKRSLETLVPESEFLFAVCSAQSGV